MPPPWDGHHHHSRAARPMARLPCGRMIQVDDPTAAQARKSTQRRRRQRVTPLPGAPPAAGTRPGPAGCGRSADRLGAAPRHRLVAGRTRDSSTPSPRVRPGQPLLQLVHPRRRDVALRARTPRRAVTVRPRHGLQPRQHRQHAPSLSAGHLEVEVVHRLVAPRCRPAAARSSAPVGSGSRKSTPVLDMLLSNAGARGSAGASSRSGSSSPCSRRPASRAGPAQRRARRSPPPR